MFEPDYSLTPILIVMRYFHLSIFALMAYIWCTPALAIRCERVATESEKQICLDPALIRLDAELNSAYDTLLDQGKGTDLFMLASEESRGTLKITPSAIPQSPISRAVYNLVVQPTLLGSICGVAAPAAPHLAHWTP